MIIAFALGRQQVLPVAEYHAVAVVAERAAAVEDADPGGPSGPERVTALIQEANRRVYERASVDPTVSGMGTTMRSRAAAC